MKTIFKTIGVLLLFVFLFCNNHAKSQEVVLMDADTVIMITPKNLRTINCIIADYEFTKETLSLTERIAEELKIKVILQDSISENQSVIIQKQSDLYTETVAELNSQIEKEKRKRKWTNGLIGGAAGLVVILLLVN